MMRWLRRLLGKPAPLIAAVEFDAAVARLPILRGLGETERARLRTLASAFIRDKRYTVAGGATPDRRVELAIALQACLLILNLDAHSYRGWREIVLYPEAFLKPQKRTDAAGVVHEGRAVLTGESWHRGPLVLSVADAWVSGQGSGSNVVLHEFAHKLDMLNGTADGFPPLHRGMDSAAWTRDFKAAYDDFVLRVRYYRTHAINPYAATTPAEFFAVLSEVFFETPATLFAEYPAVYRQLQQFYRQDPFARLGSSAVWSVAA
jgi:Mlc titration factor MtfA (ptsG expression regulator)